MRKAVFLFLLVQQSVMCQCTISNLIPFEFGFSKFAAIEKGQTLKTWQSEYKIPLMPGEWKKEKYMKNDSVYFSQWAVDMKKADCFTGDANYFRLSFADDRLYKIQIFMRYNVANYQKMKIDYDSLLTMLKSEFPYVTPFQEIDQKTKEQQAEGYSLNRLPLEKQDKLKLNTAEISYKINYKSRERFYGLESASEVESYTIEVLLLNLQGTKLTSQGNYK
jgi:hypothetical protein